MSEDNGNNNEKEDERNKADRETNGSKGAEDNQPLPKPPVADPFDPMNLGIPTEYAASINAKASAKGAELLRPNDQEYFRVSPLPNHHLTTISITDKQDKGKKYLIDGRIRDQVVQEFPKAVGAVELMVTQTLVGAILVWPVPLAEDRGGRWNSTQRQASEQGKRQWTMMASNSSRAEYEIRHVDNPKVVDWETLPPFNEILRQAASELLVATLDHPLLQKLRGQID